jgi:hypothetical protein
MTAKTLKHGVALVAGILFFCMGAEILLLGKSSIPSAGWHARGQVVTTRKPQLYSGWKRLTGLWMVIVGGAVTVGAFRAIRK